MPSIWRRFSRRKDAYDAAEQVRADSGRDSGAGPSAGPAQRSLAAERRRRQQQHTSGSPQGRRKPDIAVDAALGLTRGATAPELPLRRSPSPATKRLSRTMSNSRLDGLNVLPSSTRWSSTGDGSVYNFPDSARSHRADAAHGGKQKYAWAPMSAPAASSLHASHRDRDLNERKALAESAVRDMVASQADKFAFAPKTAAF